MSHSSGNEIQDLYEGDQSKLYSGVMSHHGHSDVKSAESKTQIKRIIKVLGWLSLITIVEIGLGILFTYKYPHAMSRGLLNSIFLILTLVKAGAIVAVFMHLGDEVKSFKYLILIPLVLFIWFVIAFLYDGGFWLHINASAPMR